MIFRLLPTSVIMFTFLFLGKTTKAQDFDWDIEPDEGFPVITFDQGNADSEVVFRYSFTGTLSESKYLEAKLYQDDCLTEADASALGLIDFVETNQLHLDVDIVQSAITNSVHYSGIGDKAANIAFCVRVDYNYKDGNGDVMVSDGDRIIFLQLFVIFWNFKCKLTNALVLDLVYQLSRNHCRYLRRSYGQLHIDRN